MKSNTSLRLSSKKQRKLEIKFTEAYSDQMARCQELVDEIYEESPENKDGEVLPMMQD